MEATMHILVFGHYVGEYVAECAGSQCGYLGLFISLDWGENLTLDLPSTIGENVQQGWGPCQEIPSERFVVKSLLAFTHENAQIKQELGEVAPPLCLHHSEISQGPRSLKRKYAIAGE